MGLYRNYDEDKLMDSDSYGDHVHAMTAEGLHSKAEIAAELAVRDDKIDVLEDKLRRIRSCVDTPSDTEFLATVYNIVNE